MNMKRIKKRIKQKIQKAKLYLPGSDDPMAGVECQITLVVDVIEISERPPLNSLDAWEGELWILQEYQSIPQTRVINQIRKAIFENREFRLQLENDRNVKIIIKFQSIKSGEKKIGPIYFQGSGLLE